MADLSVTAASVVATTPSRTKRGIAAATITAGQLLAQDSSGNLVLCDADHATAVNRVPVGIATCGGATGQPITYEDDDATFTPGATVAVGMPYFASVTAGGISPVGDCTTGNYTSFVGIGKTASVLMLKITPGPAVALAADIT